jgi:cation:H+ antiporter
VLTLPRTGTYLILGLVALYFGGGWVVGGATGLAAAWGVDDALIGLTVIAIGTSSPEIFTSAVAAYRNQADLAIGNAVGSNIFNLLLVLGSTAAIVELPFEVISNTDLAMVIAASALLILALAASRTNTVRRAHGAVFVVLYGLYVWYAIFRE